jgi:succinate-semialdehyde dehydrogenase/glutarate-semialdehyde dehydrogenase
VGPALAAGCCVVIKPAEDTPLSALALAELAAQAGLPDGVLNVIPTDKDHAAGVGEILTSHEAVRKISFTGSTEVGKILMRQASSTIKHVSLELGGNAPCIVFASADLEKAAEAILNTKFRNAGQTCISANRIFIEKKIHDSFVKILKTKIEALKIGPGDKDGVEIGPLINEEAVSKVKSHVEDALSKGAQKICGGKIDGQFFEPTLLTGMTPAMLAFGDETFGPVAALYSFEDEAELLQLANATRYGLAAYFYTTDLGQAFRIAEGLHYGMIAVNEAFMAHPTIPFGGMKESGLGRLGGRLSLDEFMETKYVLFGGLSGKY